MNDGYVTARLGPGKCDAGRPLSAAGACPGGVAGRHAGPYESCGRPQTLQRRFASASGQRPVASADCGGAALECGRLRPLCSAGACPGAFIVAVNHREHRDHREGTGSVNSVSSVVNKSRYHWHGIRRLLPSRLCGPLGEAPRNCPATELSCAPTASPAGPGASPSRLIWPCSPPLPRHPSRPGGHGAGPCSRHNATR